MRPYARGVAASMQRIATWRNPPAATHHGPIAQVTIEGEGG